MYSFNHEAILSLFKCSGSQTLGVNFFLKENKNHLYSRAHAWPLVGSTLCPRQPLFFSQFRDSVIQSIGSWSNLCSILPEISLEMFNNNCSNLIVNPLKFVATCFRDISDSNQYNQNKCQCSAMVHTPSLKYATESNKHP